MKKILDVVSAKMVPPPSIPRPTLQTMSSTAPPPMTHGWEKLRQGIEPIPLRVLQWNTLADGLDVTGKFVVPNPDAVLPWEVRGPRIVARVHGWSPDIVCMQEANHPNLMMHDTFDGGCDGEREYTGEWVEKRDSPCIPLGYHSDGCVIYWRTRLFTPVATHRIAYKHPETGALWNQVALVVVLQDERKRYWVVATTHLKAKSGAANAAKRASQSAQLLAAVDTIVSKLDGPAATVVCGDFNSPPNEGCAREWGRAGYRSVYPVGGERCWTTWKVREGVGEVCRQIDYMLVRGPVAVLSRLLPPTGAEATPLPTKDLPSDHLPLCAELEWSSGSADTAGE